MTASAPEQRQPREAAPRRELAPELVVMCAANNYDTVKVADHHMAECLARRAPVLYVDPPLSHLSPRNNPQLAPSLEGPSLRRTPTGFWRLTPVVAPFPGRPAMRSISQRLTRRALKRAVQSIGLRPRVVLSAWPQLDVFGCLDEQLRVWWAQDDFAAAAELIGGSAKRIAAGEAARAKASDLVVAASPEVAARWQREGYDVELIPYGADVESFAEVERARPAAGVDLPGPIAILVGQLNERTDPALLEAVADSGVSLLLVGPATGTAASWLSGLTARSNVQWVGGQPFDALPSLLAHADVGLVPYVDSAFNRGSFPLKTLEYLAAGLPVVATDLPATRWLAAGPELVRIAAGARPFAEAVRAFALTPRTPQLRDAARAFASGHSYERRAEELLAAIDRRVPPAPSAN